MCPLLLTRMPRWVYNNNHQMALSVVHGSVFYRTLCNRQLFRIKHSGLSLRWAVLHTELCLPHTRTGGVHCVCPDCPRTHVTATCNIQLNWRIRSFLVHWVYTNGGLILVLFVLNQRVFARRGQPFTATFKRRLIDKTSLASAIMALSLSPPQRTCVVSWSVIMRSR